MLQQLYISNEFLTMKQYNAEKNIAASLVAYESNSISDKVWKLYDQ